MYWIYDYPRWAIAILFVAVFAGVTWTGIFLTRATVHSWIHREKRANEMVGLALSSFFVLFGLLLGLVAVATYQNYSNVTDTVDKEASSIAALDRDFNAFPQPVRGQLKDRLAEYARFTIEEGWPQQRKGIIPSSGAKRIASLFQVLSAFEPAKKSEEIFYAEALREFNRLIEVRRMRLANVLVGLPPVLWWVVTFGALMSVVLIWLQDMEIHVHLILGGILASILGAVIFLIAMLDNPFRGGIGFGPDSIVLVYETLMKPDGNGTAAGDAHQQPSPGSAPR
jgi:hypothetical protein